MVYTQDTIAIIKPFTSIEYDQDLSTMKARPVLGIIEPVLVKEIGGLVGRIINLNSPSKIMYLVGNWPSIPVLQIVVNQYILS